MSLYQFDLGSKKTVFVDLDWTKSDEELRHKLINELGNQQSFIAHVLRRIKTLKENGWAKEQCSVVRIVGNL